MVWRIVLNGVEPYKFLRWEVEGKAHVAAMKSQHGQDGQKNSLSSDDFNKIKHAGDTLLHLALQTLQETLASDAPSALVCDILSCTLRKDTGLRATSFAQIIDLFSEEKSSSNKDGYITFPKIFLIFRVLKSSKQHCS